MALKKGKTAIPSDLTRQVRELETLIMLNQKIAMQADLDSLLQTIVDCARDLIGAKMGGLVVVDENNPRQLRHFKVSGVPPAKELPTGHGLFMVPYRTGQAVRLDQVPLSHAVNKPANHPRLGSFLGVPLKSLETLLGSLFLAESPHGRHFTQRDQDLLSAFATQAAIALESVRSRDQLARILVLEERERISMALHSSVAQTLFLLKMEISRCQQHLPQNDEELLARLTAMQELAERGLQDVKTAIFSLTDNAPSRGLAALISQMLVEFEKDSGIKTKFLCTGNDKKIGSATVSVARAIAHEALTNIRKHSHSEVAVITLSIKDRETILAIHDMGVGLPPSWNAPLSYGIRSMDTLARRIGGQFAIFNHDDGGTTVRVVLPNNTKPRSSPCIE
ncbi:Histidine kinase [Sulfobacillus thermosulfidooxidans DSM 9293]|uniref:histidine kinase n=1 Tax=Sulfobacillus thermosulfidooxidans (strain DSM 9293 / VKM B-1269 / AT-1) TaxID=929705 RepID=A0A1W1WHN0_SULTA|nr:GAF domain-containing protein [Sulfobacillus thermosulfidooxidans]SMC05818.1 Histidine kinase [Sulfobacillus thermosulfidooxidans DSM 9293]